MMDKEIDFDMSQLDKFSIIDSPGTYFVRVLSTVKQDNLYTDDGHNRWIVTLKAITELELSTVRAAMKTSTLRYKDVYNLFLTGALWETQILNEIELPVKGEEVICVFNYVEGRLLCTNLNVIPRKRAKQFIYSKEVMNDLKELQKIINGK